MIRKAIFVVPFVVAIGLVASGCGSSSKTSSPAPVEWGASSATQAALQVDSWSLHRADGETLTLEGQLAGQPRVTVSLHASSSDGSVSVTSATASMEVHPDGSHTGSFSAMSLEARALVASLVDLRGGRVDGSSGVQGASAQPASSVVHALDESLMAQDGGPTPLLRGWVGGLLAECSTSSLTDVSDFQVLSGLLSRSVTTSDPSAVSGYPFDSSMALEWNPTTDEEDLRRYLQDDATASADFLQRARSTMSCPWGADVEKFRHAVDSLPSAIVAGPPNAGRWLCRLGAGAAAVAGGGLTDAVCTTAIAGLSTLVTGGTGTVLATLGGHELLCAPAGALVVVAAGYGGVQACDAVFGADTSSPESTSSSSTSSSAERGGTCDVSTKCCLEDGTANPKGSDALDSPATPSRIEITSYRAPTNRSKGNIQAKSYNVPVKDTMTGAVTNVDYKFDALLREQGGTVTIDNVYVTPEPFTGFDYRYRPGASAMSVLMDTVVTHIVCQLPNVTKIILKRQRNTEGYEGEKCVSKTYGNKPGSLDKFRNRCS